MGYAQNARKSCQNCLCTGTTSGSLEVEVLQLSWDWAYLKGLYPAAYQLGKSDRPVDYASTSLAKITLQDNLLEKVDVVARICNRPANDCHLFQNVRMYTRSLEFNCRALIDCGCLFNLISQSIIKRYGIPGSNNDVPSAKDLNSGASNFSDGIVLLLKQKAMTAPNLLMQSTFMTPT